MKKTLLSSALVLTLALPGIAAAWPGFPPFHPPQPTSNGNNAYVYQNNNAFGNSATIDQATASVGDYAVITEQGYYDTATITQTRSNNSTARIYSAGWGDQVEITQKDGSGNYAEGNVNGGAYHTVNITQENGSGNYANGRVNYGWGNTINITQNGNGNSALDNVSGAYSDLLITQTGENHIANGSINGFDSDVKITQEGSTNHAFFNINGDSNDIAVCQTNHNNYSDTYVQGNSNVVAMTQHGINNTAMSNTNGSFNHVTINQ